MLMSRDYKTKESSQIPVFVLQAAGLPYSPPLPPPPSHPPLPRMSHCPKKRENQVGGGWVGFQRCHKYNVLCPGARASASRAQSVPPSHLGQNLCIWRAAKQQQRLRSTHLVPSLRGIHVDVSVQVVPVPALENLSGKGGGKSHQSGDLGTGATKMGSPSRPAPCGTGHEGWGRPYRILFRVIQLGSPQPALDLGERVGWYEPHTSPGEAGGPPSPGTHREGARHPHQADEDQDTPHGCFL